MTIGRTVARTIGHPAVIRPLPGASRLSHYRYRPRRRLPALLLVGSVTTVLSSCAATGSVGSPSYHPVVVPARAFSSQSRVAPLSTCVTTGTGLQLQLRSAICQLQVAIGDQVRGDTEDAALIYGFAASEQQDSFLNSFPILGLEAIHAGEKLAQDAGTVTNAAVTAALGDGNVASAAAGIRALADASSSLYGFSKQADRLDLWPEDVTSLMKTARNVYGHYGGILNLLHATHEHPGQATDTRMYNVLYLGGTTNWATSPASSPLVTLGVPIPQSSRVNNGHHYIVDMVQLLQECESALDTASLNVPSRFPHPASAERLLGTIRTLNGLVATANTKEVALINPLAPTSELGADGLAAADFAQASEVIGLYEHNLKVAEQQVIVTGLADEAQVVIYGLSDSSGAGAQATSTQSVSASESALQHSTSVLDSLGRPLAANPPALRQATAPSLGTVLQSLRSVSARRQVDLVTAPQAMANLATQVTEGLCQDGHSLWQMADNVATAVAALAPLTPTPTASSLPASIPTPTPAPTPSPSPSIGTGPPVGNSPITWSAPQAIDPSAELSGVSCPSSGFCVVEDGTGQAFIWNGASWSASQKFAGYASISCPSARFCLAVDDWGNALTWNGTVWAAVKGIPPNEPGGWLSVKGVSCASASFCVAAVDTATVEMWDGTSWSASQVIDPYNGITEISCASASFCVAVDTVGNALNWNGTIWSAPEAIISFPDYPAGISCASASFCVAVSQYGTATTWNGTVWSAAQAIEPDGPGGWINVGGVSCATASFCVAVELWYASEQAIVWDGSRWSTPQVVGHMAYNFAGVSCPSARFCVATDNAGEAFIGRAG